MARTLATIIAEHQEEIADAWMGRLRLAEGSGFAGRADDRIGPFSRPLLRALLSAVAEGHQGQSSAFVREICPRFAAAGFRLSEIQRAVLLLKEVLDPYLAGLLHADTDAFLSARRAVDRFLESIVFELSERYPSFVRDHVDTYVKHLEERNRTLERQVLRDGLTGLYNRRYMQDRLREELARAHRYRRDLALLLLDVDHFKRVNDTLGHPAGDLALARVARTLRSTIRDTDIPARYGGDEFAVILPEASHDGGRAVGERIRAAVEAMDASGVEASRITVSVGIAAFPIDADDAALLIEQADRALYQAKRDGKNRVAVAGSARSPETVSSRAAGESGRPRWLSLTG